MKTLNYYQNIKQPTVLSATTDQKWFALVRDSKFKEKIELARAGELDYDMIKGSMPAVTYNFLFDKYKKDANIIASTGLMYIDIDAPDFDLNKIDLNKVYACHRSFGGYGWVLIIQVEGLNKDNFKQNYIEIVNQLGINQYVDTNAIKASQYNVLSYDPNIFINSESIKFEAKNCTPTVGISKKEEGKAYTHGGGTVLNYQALRFDNLDDFEFEGDFTVNWEGYDWIRCWIPIKKVSINRNKLLLSYCNNLVWLNPHISKERCLGVLEGVNQVAFISEVPVEQLQRVINSIFSEKEKGMLKPILFHKKRKIIFKKNGVYNACEKREIVLSLCNEHKTNETKQKIYSIIEGWDFTLHGKISIRNISKNYPVSKKTVAKYYPEFKEYINEKNKNESK